MNFFHRHAYDIGSGLARLLLPFIPGRVRIATENIMRSGIESDKAKARTMAKHSIRHFVGHICEAICVPAVVTKENWREHLDFEGVPAETIKLLLETPEQPIVLASSHHGTWEPATNILSITRPMIAITRIQNNKFVAKWMRDHHFRGPVTLVDKNKGMSASVLRKWKQDCAALTLLMDQYAHGGALVSFFGRPARTFTTAARLAIRTGYPIVIGSFVRTGDYRYRLVGGTPVRFEKDADLQKSVQLLNDRLEAAIRQYPEQYLWMHRRWRDD